MDYDIIVLGAGSGGLNTAIGCGQFGLRTLLIEKDKIGGDCLHYGCVPSKTLISSARVLHTMKTAYRFGLDIPKTSFSFKKVMEHMQSVIKGIEKDHDNPEVLKRKGVEVLYGDPYFVSPHSIIVGDQTITGRKFVIATGSSPLIPPIVGLKETGYLTNMEIFSLKTLPASLAIIGGGPIGVELSQVFARFGTSVTILEGSDHILSREDSEIAIRLESILKHEGVQIICNTRPLKVEKSRKGKRIIVEQNTKQSIIEAEEILVATGRSPNIATLNLEAAGVTYDKRKVITDNRLRTSTKHIYACGDVTGSYLFTHAAEYQAGIIIANAVFHLPKKTDYSVMPWTTFTDPELARVGIIESDAKARGIPHKVYILPYHDIDRARTDEVTEGLVKLVANPKGKILGVSILGDHAGEHIGEFSVVMKAGLSLRAITDTIHVYPTMGRLARQIAGKFYTEKLFSPTVKKIAKILGRW